MNEKLSRSILRRTLTVLHGLEDLFLLGLILLAVCLAITQIVLRNSGADALLWADQALNIFVLWIAMAGALVATRERNHIAIDLLSHYLTGLSRRIIEAATYLATTLVCAVTAWYGAGFVLEEREYGDIVFLNVPLWVCEAIIPLVLALIALRYALYTVQILMQDDTTGLEAR
ncbi:MAG: TRAP transporter small permease [Pseudomonadales bacterium]